MSAVELCLPHAWRTCWSRRTRANAAARGQRHTDRTSVKDQRQWTVPGSGTKGTNWDRLGQRGLTETDRDREDRWDREDRMGQRGQKETIFRVRFALWGYTATTKINITFLFVFLCVLFSPKLTVNLKNRKKNVDSFYIMYHSPLFKKATLPWTYLL